MRIVFLSRFYPPDVWLGGIGSYTACATKALACRGHEVHVLSCHDQQSAADYVDEGVHVHRRELVSPRGIAEPALANTTDWFRHGVSCLLAYQDLGVAADVVEIPDWRAEGLFLSMASLTPTVARLHSGVHEMIRYRVMPRNVDSAMCDALERVAVLQATVIVSPSELLARALTRDGWLEDRSVRIARYPVDLERWEEVPDVRNTGPLVLQSGRLEPRKAPDLLISAVGELIGEVAGVEIAFVGNTSDSAEAHQHLGYSSETVGSSYTDRLREQAQTLGVPCRFLGPVPRSQLPRILAQARVVAVPSTFDNFPMSGLEAMASSRPVVCSSNTGLAELIDGTDAGTVVAPNDPAELAQALKKYLIDIAVAAHAGHHAKEVVRTHCHPDQIAAQLEQIYSEACSSFGIGGTDPAPVPHGTPP